MYWIYLFILLFGGEISINLASSDGQGLVPYRFGVAFFCRLFHLFVLILSIRYCGWIAGIVVFAAHFFSIIHAVYSWPISLPSLFFSKDEQVLQYIRIEMGLLSYIFVPGALIFTIFSFFSDTWMSLYHAFTVPRLVLTLAIGLCLVCVALSAKGTFHEYESRL